MRTIEKIFSFVRETLRGKSLGRIYSNWLISEKLSDIDGAVLDLGSGDRPSFLRRIRFAPGTKLTTVDINSAHHPDVVADINKPLPFAENSADHVMLWSVLYIVRDPARLLEEIRRVLKKPGGKLWLTTPFLLPESPEPHDYVRFTSEGLYRLLETAGFAEINILPIGERFSVAASIIGTLLPFSFLRLPLYLAAWALDCLVPRALRERHPLPLGYFGSASVRGLYTSP